MDTLPPNLRFDAPIPGQSLTNSPESPFPFERPPEYTDYQEAVDYLFESLVTEDSKEIVGIIARGVPIETLATQIAFGGFSKGKWNPDLMLLLLEPIVYILLFISEQAGVDYVLSFDEEVEFLEPEGEMQYNKHVKQASSKAVKKASSGEMDIGSLLGRGDM